MTYYEGFCLECCRNSVIHSKSPLKGLRVKKCHMCLGGPVALKKIPSDAVKAMKANGPVMFMTLRKIWDAGFLGDWAIPGTPQGESWDYLREVADIFRWEKPKKE